MNPEDLIVRIEKIVGNFPKKERAAVLETTAELTTKASRQPSAPLTDDEIAFLRESFRGRISEVKTGGDRTAKTETDTPQLRPGESPAPGSGRKEAARRSAANQKRKR